MDVSSCLEWPFFTPDHGELVRRVDAWATAWFANRRTSEDRDSVDHACRQLVRELGRAGFTRYSVPSAGAAVSAAAHSAGALGVRAETASAAPTFDVRSLAGGRARH